MKKRSFLFLGIVMLFSLVVFPNSSFAQEPEFELNYTFPPIIDLSDDDTMYDEVVDQSKAVVLAPTRRTYKITSKKVLGYGYGAYRSGPSGKGPGTLSINSSTTISRSYTNTISGDYPIGKKAISHSLGVTIGKSKTYGTSYSISIEKGKRKQIIYRPRYKNIQVKQRLYANGVATNIYKYATVKVFNNWDYSWKYIK